MREREGERENKKLNKFTIKYAESSLYEIYFFLLMLILLINENDQIIVC